MAYWHLLLSGAGLEIAQTLVTRRHPEVKALNVALRLPALPVWLVRHQDARASARIRQIADHLAAELGKALR